MKRRRVLCAACGWQGYTRKTGLPEGWSDQEALRCAYCVSSGRYPNAVRVRWTKPKPRRPSSGKLPDAITFLQSRLANGPVRARVLLQVAAEQGIPASTLRHAKRKLGVRASTRGWNSTWTLQKATEAR